MQRIYKYLYDFENQSVILPFESKILRIAILDGTWYVWALVNEEDELVKRILPYFGTGWSVPSDVGPFIATVFDGPYVWHFFDNGETKLG